MSDKEIVTIDAEYLDAIIALAKVASRMSKRAVSCGYFDPVIMVLCGEADSHLEDLREMDKEEWE